MGQEAARQVTEFDGFIPELTLEDLIRAYGPAWVDQITHTLLTRIAKVLAKSDGVTEDELIARLKAILGDPDSAERIALTEITRAAGEAAVEVYRAAGVPEVIWVTDPASNVCALCDANEAAGPRFLGTPFPSGAIAPPQHVRCRCALLPYRS